MKRVLITGITGFVGSHMADHILKNVPDVKIYGIKRWRSRDENILHLLDNKQVTFLEADLTDRGSLSRAIKRAKPAMNLRDFIIMHILFYLLLQTQQHSYLHLA